MDQKIFKIHRHSKHVTTQAVAETFFANLIISIKDYETTFVQITISHLVTVTLVDQETLSFVGEIHLFRILIGEESRENKDK